MEFIKDTLPEKYFIDFYESELKINKSKNESEVSFPAKVRKLGNNEWKYWIIENQNSEETNFAFYNLKKAFSIFDLGLFLSVDFWGEPGGGYVPEEVFNFYSDLPFIYRIEKTINKKFSVQDLEKVREIYQNIRKINGIYIINDKVIENLEKQSVEENIIEELKAKISFNKEFTLFEIEGKLPANLTEKAQKEILKHLLVSHNKEFEFIDKALNYFGLLNRLPEDSELKTLGYFIILESLLTHKPDPKDITESLTRQIKTKIALLNNRFEKRLDFQKFFGFDKTKFDEKKIMATLYNYRSNIAHGSESDFSDKNLNLLKSPELAKEFIFILTQKVLVYALKEPQLMVDLKNC